MMLVSLGPVQDLPLATLGALALMVGLAVISIWPPPRATRGAHAGHGHERAARSASCPALLWRCVRCETPTPLDDVAEWVSGDTGVCLRCLGMLTGTARPMPAALEQALRATVAEAPAP
jgi:hypothetical protein